MIRARFWKKATDDALVLRMENNVHRDTDAKSKVIKNPKGSYSNAGS